MTITVSEIAAAAAGARAAQNLALAKLLDDCAEALASAERALDNMTEHANEIDQRRFIAEEKVRNLETDLKDARRRGAQWRGDVVRLYNKIAFILPSVPLREVPAWALEETL